jgi:hypothetical protein
MERDQWCPVWVNEGEVADWKDGCAVHDYSNQLGGDGWELVNLVVGLSGGGPISDQTYRLAFKRPVP